jgi:hypothetical protein
MAFRTIITAPGAIDALVARLQRLTPESRGKWGRMSAHGMLCHVADVGFGLTTRYEGDRPRQSAKILYALHLPVAWPRGIRTPKRVDQEHGGTQPAVFDADRQRAIDSLHAMAAVPDGGWPAFHPLLGPLTDWEWRRFGWKHTDHHLRQFGL